MNKLIENQIDENQETGNELEKLYGGGSGLNCPVLEKCVLNIRAADEDDNDNIVF